MNINTEHLKEVKSISAEGYSLLVIKLEPDLSDSDKDDAVADLREAMSGLSDLPSDLPEPPDVTEVKSGPAFNKAENSKLMTAMRRTPDKAEDYARRHSIPTWHTNANDLLKRQDINAIYIATPPSTHKEYAIAALKSGKDIYLEKPMAMNAFECFEITTLAKELERKVCVAHYRRELDCFKKIKELIF